MLAQEVDEQNSRLERNTQALLQKTESKYMDQIHQLQRRFNVEKESFQHSLNAVESQLNNYKDEETRLKHQITSLSQV